MSKILRLIFLTALFLGCLSTLSQAQNDAVVVGQIDSATSRAVRVEFKRNQFLLEDGAFETVLDANNTFSFRVKMSESRSINLVHRNESVRLFLTPGDTLKLHFKSKHMLETMVYDGSAALHNDYLLKADVQLGEANNDNQAKYSVETASAKTHLAFIDSIYSEKKRFYDSYPTDIKASFSNDFLDFSLNDNTYWRAFYLMDFVRKNGFTNPNPDKQVDDTYFNFLFETDNAYYKALNNQNYLKYLDLYLGYIREKSGRGKQTDGDTTEIHTHTVQKVRSKGQNVRVLEEPYLKNEIVSWLSNSEEADYQNLSTSEKFKYVSGDTIFEDMFLKIRTPEGRYGWVPQSLVTNYDKTTFDTVHIRRFCYQPEKDFCGFEDNLTGKVLYFTMTKDILMSFMYDKEDMMRKRMTTFIGRNTSYEEYNTVLRTALQHTLVDRLRGQQNKVSIPPSLEVERYENDRAFYTVELNRLPLAKRNLNNNVELFAAKVAAREAKAKLAEEARLKAEREIKAKIADEARLRAEREAKAKLAEAQAKADADAKAKLAEAEAQAKADADAKAKLAEAQAKADADAKTKLAEAQAKADADAKAKLAEAQAKADADAKAKLAEAQAKADADAKTKLAQAEAQTKVNNEREQPTGKPALVENNPPKETTPASMDSLVKNNRSLFKQNVVTNASGVSNPNTIMNDPNNKHPENPGNMQSGNMKFEVQPNGSVIAIQIANTPPPVKPTEPVKTTPSEAIVRTTDPSKTVRFVAPKGLELDTTQEIIPLMEKLEFDPTGRFVEFKGLVLNEDMPRFVLTDINGKEVRQEDLKDKVVFIDFWASWCGPCVAQFSHVRSLIEKYKNDDVVFLFISIDSDIDAWRGHLKDNPLAGIHGNDKMILPINFQVSGIPNSFIIGRNGKVAFNSRLKSSIKDERMIRLLLESR